MAFQQSLILFIIEVIKILFHSTQTDTQFYRLRQNGIFFKREITSFVSLKTFCNLLKQLSLQSKNPWPFLWPRINQNLLWLNFLRFSNFILFFLGEGGGTVQRTCYISIFSCPICLSSSTYTPRHCSSFSHMICDQSDNIKYISTQFPLMSCSFI